MRSVVSVCTSVCCIRIGHDHSSPEIERQGYRSNSRVKVRVTVSKDGRAVGLTSILDRGQFVF